VLQLVINAIHSKLVHFLPPSLALTIRPSLTSSRLLSLGICSSEAESSSFLLGVPSLKVKVPSFFLGYSSVLLDVRSSQHELSGSKLGLLGSKLEACKLEVEAWSLKGDFKLPALAKRMIRLALAID